MNAERTQRRGIVWRSIRNKQHDGAGLEHLPPDNGTADGVIVAFDEETDPSASPSASAGTTHGGSKTRNCPSPRRTSPVRSLCARMAMVAGGTAMAAPDRTMASKPRAYTRLADRLHFFESLDGSGFRAELPVAEAGIVIDYPGRFRRVTADG